MIVNKKTTQMIISTSWLLLGSITFSVFRMDMYLFLVNSGMTMLFLVTLIIIARKDQY